MTEIAAVFAVARTLKACATSLSFPWQKQSIPSPFRELSNEQGTVVDGYRDLYAGHPAEIEVGVHSSTTAEDLPTANFAGQQDSFLNVRGEAALLCAC